MFTTEHLFTVNKKPPLSGGVWIAQNRGREVEVEGFPNHLGRGFEGDVLTPMGVEHHDCPLAGLGVEAKASNGFGSEGDASGSVSEQFAVIAFFGGGVHLVLCGLCLSTPIR